MEESCFSRVSLCDQLFERVLPLSSRDLALAAQVLPYERRGGLVGLRWGHRRDLRPENELSRKGSLYSELRKD